ncbi:MAG: prepilin-type N-terminal cleavage/methylation domain-containing protein [Candidatus Omnitrophota bacterium]
MQSWRHTYRVLVWKQKLSKGLAPLDRRIDLTGFTLVELLIAASIYAIVSIAVYSTFSTGMNIWRRAKEVNLEQSRVIIKLEKLCRELRQTFNFPEIGFLGTEEEVSFAQVQDSEIVRISYSFDQGDDALLRSVDTLADILQGLPEGSEPKAYIEEIEELKFSYFYFDLAENSYLWTEVWDQIGLPLAVKLKITTKEEKAYVRTIFIPTA